MEKRKSQMKQTVCSAQGKERKEARLTSLRVKERSDVLHVCPRGPHGDSREERPWKESSSHGFNSRFETLVTQGANLGSSRTWLLDSLETTKEQEKRNVAPGATSPTGRQGIRALGGSPSNLSLPSELEPNALFVLETSHVSSGLCGPVVWR